MEIIFLVIIHKWVLDVDGRGMKRRISYERIGQGGKETKLIIIRKIIGPDPVVIYVGMLYVQTCNVLLSSVVYLGVSLNVYFNKQKINNKPQWLKNNVVYLFCFFFSTHDGSWLRNVYSQNVVRSGVKHS